MSLLFELPPAGDPITLGDSVGESTAELFEGYSLVAYGSGTSALAAALRVAADVCGITRPEVVLPAYGCPNLVSAARYAGVQPVLVDLEAQRPWLDLSGVEQALNPRTVAVVAVDLFGIPERTEKLHQLARQAGAVLIQDSAQACPETATRQGAGDLVIVSFGKAKPVSLLGGGAVLTRRNDLASRLQVLSYRSGNWWRHVCYTVKASFYNGLAISPRFFGSLRRLPFLHIGETRYVPLSRIEPPDAVVFDHLARNIRSYRARSTNVAVNLSEMLTRLHSWSLIDLPGVCGVPAALRLWRYPVLVRNSYLRQSLRDALLKAGVGVSTMYPAPLARLPGLHDINPSNQYPNAEAFARQILTLPTHSGVTAEILETIEDVLGCFSGNTPETDLEAA